jgi:hypothetical protein
MTHLRLNKESIKKHGFKNNREFARLVCSIDLSNKKAFTEFKNWQYNDGTKIGLLKLLEKKHE